MIDSPRYSIKMYRPNYWRVTKFHFSFGYSQRVDLPDDDTDRGEEGKRSQALSRARSVISQIVICNDWDYFITLTLDPKKWPRYSMDWYPAFAQWIRDQRKKGIDIKYCFVPEQHEDGAWHLHGVIRGIPDSHVQCFVPGLHPQRLIDAGYLNWPNYQSKFGFCSLAPVRDPVAVGWYLTKYITKDSARMVSGFGSHLYYATIGLRRACPFGYVYTMEPLLDSCLDRVYEFCSTGMIEDKDWAFFTQFLSVSGELPEIDYGPELTPLVFSNMPLQQLSLFDTMDVFISEGEMS